MERSKIYPEISKHAEIFQSEWIKRYPQFPVNYKLSYRHKLFVKLIKQFVKDKNAKILDIGCGFGETLFLLKKAGYTNIFGIDYSSVAVDICKKIGINVERISLEEYLKFTKDSWDVIILGDILEHIYIPVEVILKIKNLLKDDGKVIISVPKQDGF
ncbi:MAG: class I SAM-dependent methyltransferase [Elusimicrobiota bacterium]|nr:class I SAM-dependent methyltransferase [Endomicrobiia bacterium]MDW8166477.1 class I SAM-dependent methyltransferase [Elusimicrobiota bacterium]